MEPLFGICSVAASLRVRPQSFRLAGVASVLQSRRLKPQQRNAPSPPAWAPRPSINRFGIWMGKSPQGDSVPFVAANSFAGSVLLHATKLRPPHSPPLLV